MSDKMMTFEEWCKKHDMDQDNQFVVAMFHDARLGTIPAENAVVIPDVSEWPNDMTHLCVEAYDEHGSWWKKLAEIPRPKPVWVPRIGEKCFYELKIMNSGLELSHIAVEECDFECDSKVMRMKPSGIAIRFIDLKPFHSDHIGKPWDEIPGGVD